jgi:hypothetical protein
MASYPRRYGARQVSTSDCVRTVRALGRLPHSQEWVPLAHGSIDVAPAAGLDNRTVTVTYEYGGTTHVATGSVQPGLTGGFVVTLPPIPLSSR